MNVREQERIQTHYLSAVRVPASQAEVTIIEVSETRCRIMTESKSAKIGTTIILALPNDQYASGQIVWKHREECGVHFHKSICLASIDSIAAHLGN